VGVRPLLDTSILVAVETERLSEGDLPEGGSISVVTLEELYLGVLRSTGSISAKRRFTFEQAMSLFLLLVVDREVSLACAEIRAEGRARGQRYEMADSLIGATARVHGLPLYTRDEGMVGMLGVDVRVV
jgi:predicted nucleic acid-binding protein